MMFSKKSPTVALLTSCAVSLLGARGGLVPLAYAFAPLPRLRSSHTAAVAFRPRTSSLASSTLPSPPPTPPDDVVVLPDASAVGDAVREIVVEAAHRSVGERGHFALAIPGGSILKMLATEGDDGADMKWTDKTTVAYVNHKCVSVDDGDLATHAKAKKLFLDAWDGTVAVVMGGTDDGVAEAASYEEQLRSLPETVLPRDEDGLPVFDLALIGVGDDGHIGSLYPDRDEVLVGKDGPWVLPVDMKRPPSITLSLPVMANAREVVVAACGVSDKYPQGKSDGMMRAVCAEGETLRTFPAVGLRGVATWIMDEAAASKLSDEYTKK